MVPQTNTIENPWTMMIVFQRADVAADAMFCS